MSVSGAINDIRGVFASLKQKKCYFCLGKLKT